MSSKFKNLEYCSFRRNLQLLLDIVRVRSVSNGATRAHIRRFR